MCDSMSNPTDDPTSRYCQRRERLSNDVQHHLIRISELSRATAEAVKNRNENLTRKLDEEVEREIGAKERALGALREHCAEHGC